MDYPKSAVLKATDNLSAVLSRGPIEKNKMMEVLSNLG